MLGVFVRNGHGSIVVTFGIEPACEADQNMPATAKIVELCSD